MSVISMFYGIIVSLYFFDNKEHKAPHIHARYQDEEVVIGIPDGNILAGKLNPANVFDPLGKYIESAFLNKFDEADIVMFSSKLIKEKTYAYLGRKITESYRRRRLCSLRKLAEHKPI